MHISNKLAKDLQKVYERKFGQNISVEEAEQTLSDIAELIRLFNETERSKK